MGLLTMYCVLIGQASTPGVALLVEATTTPPNIRSQASEVVHPLDEAGSAPRYSFSLKRALNSSLDDSTTKKKCSQHAITPEGNDAPKGAKSSTQALRKNSSRRLECRKGDASAAIVGSIDDNGKKVLTRNRYKNS
jgi:hypothetical protein